MSETTKVVTKQRFSQGFTYEDFLNQLSDGDRQPLIENMTAFQLASADANFFKDVVQRFPLKVIAIVGDNGGGRDVWRNLPIMATIAQASGMDMRIFPRDRNLDIMNLYLNQGKFMSIPVFAFFDQNLNPLCHWTERPKIATEFINRVRSEPNTKNLSEEQLRNEQNNRYLPLLPGWRLETVRELRELLSETLSR